MPDLVLQLLKYVFLAVLYIFVARAVRVIRLELKPEHEAGVGPAPSPAAARPPSRKSSKLPRKLTVVEGDNLRGQSFELGDELIIGRGDKCELVLDDSYVSQVHARIYPRDGTYVLEDLGSTNGTYLNRRRITAPAELRRGDQVKIGRTVLELRK